MTNHPISRDKRARPRIWFGLLLLAFTFSVQADQFFLSDQSKHTAYGQTMASWQLSNLQTSSQGQTVYVREGALTRQYELQADATPSASSTDAPAKGRFRLVMDVFSPANDMGGQKKGKFYVQGRWTLTGADDPQASADGAFTGDIQGRVQAELTFDPTTENRDWKGTVQIPMTRIRSNGGRPGMRPMRGGGELAIAGEDGGTLALDLKLWPKF